MAQEPLFVVEPLHGAWQCGEQSADEPWHPASCVQASSALQLPGVELGVESAARMLSWDAQ
jgi:hypothetical protein